MGLYLDPPLACGGLCVDEKCQVQALDLSHRVLPMLPGTPERRTTTMSATGDQPVCRPQCR
jgi:hypothetical protein